jgi:hypothetical protein
MLFLSHAWECDPGNLAVVVEAYEQTKCIAPLEEELHNVKVLILYPAILSDFVSGGWPI